MSDTAFSASTGPNPTRTRIVPIRMTINTLECGHKKVLLHIKASYDSEKQAITANKSRSNFANAVWSRTRGCEAVMNVNAKCWRLHLCLQLRMSLESPFARVIFRKNASQIEDFAVILGVGHVQRLHFGVVRILCLTDNVILIVLTRQLEHTSGGIAQ